MTANLRMPRLITTLGSSLAREEKHQHTTVGSKSIFARKNPREAPVAARIFLCDKVSGAVIAWPPWPARHEHRCLLSQVAARYAVQTQGMGEPLQGRSEVTAHLRCQSLGVR